MTLVLELLAATVAAMVIVVAWVCSLLRKRQHGLTDEDSEIWNGRERRQTGR